MHTTRRSFLQTTFSGLAAAGVAGALEPFNRPKAGPFRSSLAAYSMRQYLTGNKPAMTLLHFIDYCAELGLQGAEPTAYYFPAEVTDEYVDQLAARAKERNIGLSGGAIRDDLCVPDDKQLAKEIAEVKRWSEIYGRLGVPTIRVFAGTVKKGDTEAKAVARCIDALEECCTHAGKHNVKLALENHGGITAEADVMLEIVRGVKSPHFGVNFDSGNFRTADPYADLAKIAPYAIAAQVKVEVWQDGKKVPADLPRIVKILADAHYAGWVSLEYEAEPDPRTAIPGHVATLKQLLAPYAG